MPLKVLETKVEDSGWGRYPDYQLIVTYYNPNGNEIDTWAVLDTLYTDDYDSENLAGTIWRMFDDTSKPVALYLTFYDSRVEEDTYEEFFLSTADGELGEDTATEEDLVRALKNYERFKIMYLWAGEQRSQP